MIVESWLVDKILGYLTKLMLQQERVGKIQPGWSLLKMAPGILDAVQSSRLQADALVSPVTISQMQMSFKSRWHRFVSIDSSLGLQTTVIYNPTFYYSFLVFFLCCGVFIYDRMLQTEDVMTGLVCNGTGSKARRGRRVAWAQGDWRHCHHKKFY